MGAVEYLFKHDVLREVTYESVIKRLRKTLPWLVADWLIANSGDRIGEFSGLIGEHLRLRGRTIMLVSISSRRVSWLWHLSRLQKRKVIIRQGICFNPRQLSQG